MTIQMPVERQILRGLFNLQNGRCAYCGKNTIHPDDHVPHNRQLDRSTKDHLVPIAQGGKDDENNRVLACSGCNALKGQLDLATFIRCRHNPVMLQEAHRRNQIGVAPKWRQGRENKVT